MSINNITQLEICAQRDLPSTIQTLRSFKFSSKNENEYQKLRAAFYTSKEWNAGTTINIYFMNEPPSNISIKNYSLNAVDLNGNTINWDPLQIEIIKNYSNFKVSDIIPMIKRVIKERIEPIVNLKFNFVDDIFANIRINFDPSAGSWSYVGKDALKIQANEATMNFGWFNISTIIHEFGHLLGMVHEHQSPFGKPIPWNVNVVYQWASDTQHWTKEQTDQQILNKYSITVLNGSIFDPNSIMLYFYPRSLTTNNTGTSMNVRLSPYDVIYINSRYPNSSQTPAEFYMNVYKQDISNIITTTTSQPILTTTLQPVTTTSQPIFTTATLQPLITTSQPIFTTETLQPVTNIVFTNINNNFINNQTVYGDLVTNIDFKGLLTNLYINTSNIQQTFIIYILDNTNILVFQKEISSGDNKIIVNINVNYGYKINLKNAANSNLNIKGLSVDVISYNSNNITTTPIISKPINITLYLIYVFIGLIVLSFVIALVKRKFRIF